MIWSYASDYDLAAAAAEADRQSRLRDGPHRFEPIQTMVQFNENASFSSTSSHNDVQVYNAKIFQELSETGWFIREFLVTGRLSADDDRLNDDERALGIMLIEGKSPNDNRYLRPMKLAQMFLDRYRVQQQNPDGILQSLNKLLCVTQYDPEVHLTTREANLQTLDVAHKHHYSRTGERCFVDLNPCNTALRHKETNQSQKSCSLYFWRKDCQCPRVLSEPDGGKCNPRCHVLTEEFFKLIVQIELASPGGLYPHLGETDIRTEIRNAFIHHCAQHNYVDHEYLSDGNKDALLTPQYQYLEDLRERFDINAPGVGIFCSRQQCHVKFDEILRGTKNVPKGLLKNIEQQLKNLQPLPEPRVSDVPANTSGLLFSGINHEHVQKLNSWTLSRMFAMPDLIRMVTKGEFITNHEGLTHEEKSAEALVWQGALPKDGECQNMYFTKPDGTNSCRHNLPRAMKQLQVLIDHSDHFKNSPNDEFPELRKYLRFISIISPRVPYPPLSQVLACAQELEGSHDNHLRSTKSNRDVNPMHMFLEIKWMNWVHFMCSNLPELPCSNQCVCHPTQTRNCRKCFWKLDAERLYELAATESQLGILGRFGNVNFVEARKRIALEWRVIFQHSNEHEPDIIGAILNNDQPNDYPVYSCGVCNSRYLLQHEANDCCDNVGAANVGAAIEKRQVNKKDIEEDEGLMREMVDSILKWGLVGNKGRGSSWAFVGEQLSVTPKYHNLLANVTKSNTFQDFCENLGINNVDRLLQCDGIRNGCPCALHDIQLPAGVED